MHKLFDHQLAQATRPSGEVDLEALTKLVCAAYEQADRDRRRADRTISLMIEEVDSHVRERERTAELLREQKFKLDTALNNMSQGLCMYDAEGRVVLCNQRYREMMHLSPEFAAPGRTLLELLTRRKEMGAFRKEPAPFCVELLAAMTQGKTVTHVVEADDGRVMRVDNQPMASGGWVATFDDITEQRRAEDAERHNAEILTATITSMADAVLVTDGEGHVIVANPAAKALFGDRSDVGSEDWIRTYGRYLPDGVTPFPASETPIARAARGESVDNVEIVIRALDASKSTHLIANGRPLHDKSGALKGAVVVYRDVTEAKNTERQLRHAQKMDAIGQLTGGIAHDFNNILTVITGTIEILAAAVDDRPQYAAIAKMIDQAADRGAELTRHLLAFARKQPLRPRETDVNALIVETARLLRPTLGEIVEIESVLEGDAWPALVDPNQLTSAMLNLAVNARDAMPNGGKLTLESGNTLLDESYAKTQGDVRPGQYVMITVSDNGSGIPAEIRDKVFEPFFTTKGTGKGTGLGLSMVYGFVKQSGGHIRIYSEEGHGTTVKIYLPRAEARVEHAPDAQPTAPLGGRETILIVEDDTLVRQYVTAQLHGLGYGTLEAANATEALAIAGSGANFDLLFTDVIMPGAMNGQQLAREMAAHRVNLKVLFTSGYTENALLDHGRLAPGVLLLAKPYRKSELAQMLRQALETIPNLETPNLEIPDVDAPSLESRRIA
jgi:signal transduction histidine kinase/ActR/RegA family two-component response regulator